MLKYEQESIKWKTHYLTEKIINTSQSHLKIFFIVLGLNCLPLIVYKRQHVGHEKVMSWNKVTLEAIKISIIDWEYHGIEIRSNFSGFKKKNYPTFLNTQVLFKLLIWNLKTRSSITYTNAVGEFSLSRTGITSAYVSSRDNNTFTAKYINTHWRANMSGLFHNY